MARKPADQDFTDQEAERRATDALRRALSTPYKPQREMVGKSKRKQSAKPKHKKAART